MLVGGGDETKEQLRPGVVHRGKANLINQDQVRSQHLVDHLEIRKESSHTLGLGVITVALAGAEGSRRGYCLIINPRS